VAYTDYANDAKTTVMTYDGDDWIEIGTPGFSDGNTEYNSLTIYDGTPYVAYLDLPPKALVG
jgi:hypothetical protein